MCASKQRISYLFKIYLEHHSQNQTPFNTCESAKILLIFIATPNANKFTYLIFTEHFNPCMTPNEQFHGDMNNFIPYLGHFPDSFNNIRTFPMLSNSLIFENTHYLDLPIPSSKKRGYL